MGVLYYSKASKTVGRHVDDVAKIETKNIKTRLPRENGVWVGKPGEGRWYSDLDDVNAQKIAKAATAKAGETLRNGVLSAKLRMSAVNPNLVSKARGNGNGSGVKGIRGLVSNRNIFQNKFPKHEIGTPYLIPETRLKNGNGTYNYVVSSDGRLVIGKKSNTVGGGHIDLAQGQPVRAAGSVTILKGKVHKLDNSSGHYEPSGILAQRSAEKSFKDRGYNVEGKYVEKIHDGQRWKPK